MNIMIEKAKQQILERIKNADGEEALTFSKVYLNILSAESQEIQIQSERDRLKPRNRQPPVLEEK